MARNGDVVWLGISPDVRRLALPLVPALRRPVLVVAARGVARDHGGNRPIVAGSAAPSVDEAVRWFAVGARGYVREPVGDDVAELVLAIRSVARGECWIDSIVSAPFVIWALMASRSPLDLGLTRREREVLALLRTGQTSLEIAQTMGSHSRHSRGIRNPCIRSLAYIAAPKP